MVRWNRVKNIEAVEVKSKTMDFDKLMDANWHKDTENNVLATLQPDAETAVNVRVNALLSGLGHSWQPILQNGTPTDVDGLKSYMRIYKRCSGQPMFIKLDLLKTPEGVTEILRNRMTSNPNESGFEDIWSKIRPKFTDAKEIVYGTEDRGARGEIQLLFGDDITVTDSPQVGDIVNKGLFFHLDNGVSYSCGINRLICTNGVTTQASLMKGDIGDTFQTEAINRIRELVDWFCTLPNKKVTCVRELSLVFDKFSTRVINHYWKSWSERIDLKTLTYFDVVNDVTNYANSSLGYTRQSCLNIRSNINRLTKHNCPTCSAVIGQQPQTVVAA